MGKFTMRLLPFTWILFLARNTFGQDNGDCIPKLDACKKTDIIGTISCPPDDRGPNFKDDPSTSTASSTPTSTPTSTASSSQCTVDNGLDYLLGDFEYMDINICRKKCKIQAKTEADEAKKCKFWRYEYNHDTKNTECSLQTGCGEYTVGDCQDQSYCNSGQLGCYADGTPISSCELTSPTDYVNNEFHIICTDEDEGDINLYSEDVKIVPGDTVCPSIRMCAAWNEQDDNKQPYYRRAAIKCDGRSKDGWIPLPDSGSQAASNQMIGDQTKISEPTCATRCEPLTLTSYQDQYWADLICDPPLESPGVLKDPAEGEDGVTDSCILLCDNHYKMAVDCTFMEEGNKYWNNLHGDVLDDSKVICD